MRPRPKAYSVAEARRSDKSWLRYSNHTEVWQHSKMWTEGTTVMSDTSSALSGGTDGVTMWFSPLMSLVVTMPTQVPYTMKYCSSPTGARICDHTCCRTLISLLWTVTSGIYLRSGMATITRFHDESDRTQMASNIWTCIWGMTMLQILTLIIIKYGVIVD